MFMDKLMDIYECSDLLRTRMNWPEIFGTIDACKVFKDKQYRPMKSDMQERSAEKHSDGLLKYIGNTSIGKDYDGLCELSGLRFESKARDSLLQSSKTPHTKEIILKNFQGNSTGMPEQTFDYILAYDESKYTVLLASWDVCMNSMHLKMKDATITTKLLISKCDVLARNVIPVKKNVDMWAEYINMSSKAM
jgi:hypothetical protein